MPNPSNSDLVGEANVAKLAREFASHGNAQYAVVARYAVELAQQLEQAEHAHAHCREDADDRMAELLRYREALERIEQTPHFENPGGVCPACMAEAALNEGADPPVESEEEKP